MKACWVVGTDTDAGKTMLAALLLKRLGELGFAPLYLKPFQTGCLNAADAASDAAFIRRGCRLNEQDAASLYCLPEPKAPQFAADAAGVALEPQALFERLDELAKLERPLVIEASGGLLVPVTASALQIDLIRQTRAEILIAARAGLGTINHSLLTIEALRQRGLEPQGLVLMDSQGLDAAQVAENLEAIRHFSGVKICGAIGRLESVATASCASLLDSLIARLQS